MAKACALDVDFSNLLGARHSKADMLTVRWLGFVPTVGCICLYIRDQYWYLPERHHSVHFITHQSFAFY